MANIEIRLIKGFDGSNYIIKDASAMSSMSISGKQLIGTLRSGATFSVTLPDPSINVSIGTSSLAWNTTTTLATIEGKAIKATLPKTIDGWRVQGSGINSLMNSINGVGINPAFNGLGYNTKVGKTVTNKDGAQARIFMTRGGVEFEFANSDGYINQSILLSLFDGKNGTSVQLTVPAVFLNSAGLASYNYSSTKAYAIGDFVRYTTANITSSGGADYAWYRCILATTGNAPSGTVETDNTYWEYMSALKPSYYSGINPIKLLQVRLRLYLTSSIAYENGISIYWRTNGLHPSNVKLQKILGDESGPNGSYMPSSSGVSIGEASVTSIYFNQGVSNANDNKILDFIFTGFSANNTWQIVPTQFAFTGNVGSIEGTFVNRGGGTGAAMYGDFLPYKTKTLSLGNTNYMWNDVSTNKLNGIPVSSYSLNSHKHTITVSGSHKHNITTISGGSHKHDFSLTSTLTSHGHTINDPGHTHSISGTALHSHSYQYINYTYEEGENLKLFLTTLSVTENATATLSATVTSKTTGITVSDGSFTITNASTGNSAITITNVSTADTTITFTGTTSVATQ